ncbi:MAG: hypothetical protein ACI33P_05055 [Lysinibacillus sp.]
MIVAHTFFYHGAILKYRNMDYERKAIAGSKASVLAACGHGWQPSANDKYPCAFAAPFWIFTVKVLDLFFTSV